MHTETTPINSPTSAGSDFCRSLVAYFVTNQHRGRAGHPNYRVRSACNCMRIFLAIVFCGAALVTGFAQKPGDASVDAVKYFDENKRWYNTFTEHWFYFHSIPEDEVRSAIEQWEQIGADLAKPVANEGTFLKWGETHGQVFRWSEKSGFIWLDVNKCSGGPMAIVRGKVIVEPGYVRLFPFHSTGTNHGHGKEKSVANEFLFVKWRNVEYLIGKSELINFADFTAGLNAETSGLYGEPWYFSKLSGQVKGSLNELPIFPRGYESYLKKPLKAKIVSIGKSYRRVKPLELDEVGDALENQNDELVTTVRLDIGNSMGVSSGTVLRFLFEKDEHYGVEGIRVGTVFENYSYGEYVTDIPRRDCKKSEMELCEAAERRALKIGQRLSTTGVW